MPLRRIGIQTNRRLSYLQNNVSTGILQNNQTHCIPTTSSSTPSIARIRSTCLPTVGALHRYHSTMAAAAAEAVINTNMSIGGVVIPAQPALIDDVDGFADENFIASLQSLATRNDTVFTLAKALKRSADTAMLQMQNGRFGNEELTKIQENALELIAALNENQTDAVEDALIGTPRANTCMLYALASSLSLSMLSSFLQTGMLIERAELPKYSDSEYVLGVICFARELERYGLYRATAGDAVSVRCALEMVGDIQEELLLFDFRNGPLRQRYDGVKYAVKNLEDLLYDLSMVGVVSSTEKEKVSRLKKEEFVELRTQMKASDETREKVIVGGRTVQKLSKGAIFSCHRNKLEAAKNDLDKASTMGWELVQTHHKPSMEEEFPGRAALTNALEEWAEGVLFREWLASDGKVICSRQVLNEKLCGNASTDVLPGLAYLGGVVDFTGEVGRWAVVQATERNQDKLNLALRTVASVQRFFLDEGEAGASVGNLKKKTDELERNLSKIEKLVYKLSLTLVLEKSRGQNAIATNDEPQVKKARVEEE